ncbi:unnamed protein product, partial [Meganyctiphanes norvegica]
SVRPSVCLSVCLFVCLSDCLFVCLSVCMYVNAALMEEPSNIFFCKHIHIIPGSVIGTVILSLEENISYFVRQRGQNLKKGKHMSEIGKTHSSKVGLQFSHPVKSCSPSS